MTRDRHEWWIAGMRVALIDLYRKRSDRGREMAELARLADHFSGTAAGEQARAALRRLKERE